MARTAGGRPRDFALPKYPGNPGAGFKKFLAEKPADAPFFYWFGSHNPHRPYKAGAGLAAGKKLSDIDRVPAYWPDNDTVRGDMLDYATEVEAFDGEVASLLETLAESGYASNTLVIVTSDHGMPFPRVKGCTFEDAHRVPFVAHWPAGLVQPGRRAGELISFIDLAPTFLEVLGVDAKSTGMSPITGRSLTDVLRNRPAVERPFAIIGRERNDAYARPGSASGLGYPVRAIRSGDYLLVRNFEPDRWPSGNPELDLKDVDGSPTKQWIAALPPTDIVWQGNFGRHPAEQLFNVAKDPDCVVDLAGDPAFRATREQLLAQLLAELKRQEDPRVLGEGKVFDEYRTSKSMEPGWDQPARVKTDLPE